MPEAPWVRRVLHKFVPASLHDPVGLARRLMKSRDPAALFAIRAAALGPALLPFDLLLTPFERARYQSAAPPTLPILIVCGCARSGTTVAAQLLIHRLPVAYFTNLTSVFPRAPLTASSLIGRMLPRAPPSLHNFYGRSSSWMGPNDGLHLWDRWLGSDRSRVPEALTPAARAAMVAFFGAHERQSGRPMLAKINALDTAAHVVADALPTARFICVERSRVSLANSLLKARMEIHGRPDIPYGIMPPGTGRSADPVEDVCRQVLFHEQAARLQEERLGSARFLRVRLEDIGRDPDGFVQRVARDFLGERPSAPEVRLRLEPRPAAVEPAARELENRIEKTFERLTRPES
jgi:Sulfotransferase family